MIKKEVSNSRASAGTDRIEVLTYILYAEAADRVFDFWGRILYYPIFDTL